MRKILVFALFAASAFGQSDNSIHVKAFDGRDVGAKVAAAQQTCANASTPCILVVDASLAAFPSGTLPSLCANCYLLDYRQGPPGAAFVNLPVISPCSLPGATADVKIQAALSALGSGGTVDARCFGATTQSIVDTINVGDGTHRFTLVFDPATNFEPADDEMVMLSLSDLTYTYGFNATVDAGFDGAAILLNAETGAVGHFVLDGANIAGPNGVEPTGQGACFSILASPSVNQAFARFSNLSCSYVYTGLYMATATTGFINGNVFSNLFFDSCVQCIVAYGDSNSGPVAGNSFSNIIIESHTWTTDPILLTGVTQNNSFNGINVWDTVGTYDVKIQDKGLYNSFFGFFAKGFDDESTNGSTCVGCNEYINTYTGAAQSGNTSAKLKLLNAYSAKSASTINPLNALCTAQTTSQSCVIFLGNNAVEVGNIKYFYNGLHDAGNYVAIGDQFSGLTFNEYEDGSAAWDGGAHIASSSKVVQISGTQTAGQLACIKSVNPTVLGTCTAVSGATCSTCN